MKKTIVIFGATGSIGTYLVDGLLDEYNVIAVGKRISDNGFFRSLDVRYVNMDISDRNSFGKLPDNVFAVLHFAGDLPARMDCEACAHKYIDTNIKGTLNILNYALNADRIIFAHSISDVNYAGGTNVPIKENTPSKFPVNDDHSIYAISKIAAVNLIEHYFYKYNLKRFILRLPNIYLYHPNPYYYVDGLLKWQGYRLLIEKAKRQYPIEVWGDPRRVKDLMYVKDLVRMVGLCLETDVDGGLYNAGTGIGTTLEDEVRNIVEVFSGNKSPITYMPEKPDTFQFVFDISNAKRDLGYEPEFTGKSWLYDLKFEMDLQRFKRLWGEEKIGNITK
jgi:nucleoside-diphosphate-sugar epimerase